MNIIGIQIGSKDRDEVIPAEMCVIAPNQWYTPKTASQILIVNGQFFFKEPPGSPGAYQHWNQQPCHSQPALSK
jgi:hypothetical protein